MANTPVVLFFFFSFSFCPPFSTILYLRLLSSSVYFFMFSFFFIPSNFNLSHIYFPSYFFFLPFFYSCFLTISSLFCLLPPHSSTFLLPQFPFYYLLLLCALYLLSYSVLFITFSL